MEPHGRLAAKLRALTACSCQCCGPEAVPGNVCRAGRSPQEAPLRLRLDGGHRRSDFSSGPTQASSPLGESPGQTPGRRRSKNGRESPAGRPGVAREQEEALRSSLEKAEQGESISHHWGCLALFFQPPPPSMFLLQRVRWFQRRPPPGCGWVSR